LAKKVEVVKKSGESGELDVDEWKRSQIIPSWLPVRRIGRRVNEFAKIARQIGENGDSAAQIVEFRTTTFGKTFAEPTAMLTNETHRDAWAVILAGSEAVYE
jgi:hypothetical protein